MDGECLGTGTGNHSNSGAVTTTNPNDLLIGANYVAVTVTSTGYRIHAARDRTDPDGSILEDRVVTTAGSYSGTAAAHWRPAGSCKWSPSERPMSGPPDTSAPSTPANLIATATSSSQINLSWTASTDNVAVSASDRALPGRRVCRILLR